MMKTKSKIFIFIFAGMLLLIVAVWLKYKNGGNANILPAKQAFSLQEAFVATAKKTSPAVVIIKTGRQYVRTRDYYSFIPGKTPIYRIPQNQGSGFFVTDTGYIVTNHHIVRKQDFFSVKLYDGRSFPAKLAGTDPASDLAILKIDADEKFPFLEFAPKDSVKVGHWAIAIGAPFNLEHTVTAGIISHKKRAVGLNLYENYIQTDASINPGNSGGPLLNLKGEVVGVNDFILSPGGGNIGLSFAISGTLAKKITQQLIEHGKVSRPWLGIAMADLPNQLKRKTKLQFGAVITAVQNYSPASIFNLQVGDIILKVNARTVNNSADVQQEIMKLQPGAPAELVIYRNGRIIEYNIPTAQAPDFIQRRNYPSAIIGS